MHPVNPVTFSNAFSLALHAMVLLAQKPLEKKTTQEISQFLGASSNHLSKVHTRLVRHGLVTSARGPSGGLILARDPFSITVLDVYTAVEGPLQCCSCAFHRPLCTRSSCVFGSLFSDFNTRLKEYFEKTTLSDLVETGSIAVPEME